MPTRHDRCPATASARRCWSMVALCLLAWAPPGHSAAATAYRFTLLPTLGGPSSGAGGINNAGQVVGWSETLPGFYGMPGEVHAVRWLDGQALDLGQYGNLGSKAMGVNEAGAVVGVVDRYLNGTQVSTAILWTNLATVSLPTLGGPSGTARDINNTGLVVGESDTAGSDGRHATVWKDGAVSQLATLGEGSSTAVAVNDQGVAVGFSYLDATGRQRPTIWQGGTAADLGTLGGTNGVANDINTAGVAVGYSFTAGDLAYHATRWDGTTATDLGTLGGHQSGAGAINAAGQIVGNSWTTEDTDPHAVIWNGNVATDLNTLLVGDIGHCVLRHANGINDSGWISGVAVDAWTGHEQAFLLTPVPEPATGMLMLSGLAATFLMSGRLGRCSIPGTDAGDQANPPAIRFQL